MLVEKMVIPHNRVFTVLIIIVQASAAACIFSRGGLARPGLMAGGIFALAAALVSNPGGMATKFIMGVVMILLGVTH
jgi:hypothetical protein